jgi:hypothetical protein
MKYDVILENWNKFLKEEEKKPEQQAQQPQVNATDAKSVINLVSQFVNKTEGQPGPDEATMRALTSDKGIQTLKALRTSSNPKQAAQLIVSLYQMLSPEDKAEIANKTVKLTASARQIKNQNITEQDKSASEKLNDLSLQAMSKLGGGDINKGFKLLGGGAFIAAMTMAIMDITTGNVGNGIVNLANGLTNLVKSSKSEDVLALFQSSVEAMADPIAERRFLKEEETIQAQSPIAPSGQTEEQKRQSQKDTIIGSFENQLHDLSNTATKLGFGAAELKTALLQKIEAIIKEELLYEKKDRCYKIAKRKYDVFPSAYACVPESTSKALTKDGWKTVDQLSINEEILTFNMDKDILEFKPIQNLHRYKNITTNIVKSGNTGFVFESTPNHKWVVKLPETVSERQNKYERNHNNYSLIQTEEILSNKHNKLLVVSAPYVEGNKTLKNKIYKYGDNWINYLLEANQEQRQAWLFSAIVYDGNQNKTQRLTQNNNNSDLEWQYDGNHGKQSFGFKQKDIIHRDAFLLSAFLNEGLVTWKKAKNKEIYSCNYTSNKRYKNASNFKLVSQNTTDVWCPQTENSTWVMMQETNGQGIITITGNSGAIVKCRQGKIWKGVSENVSDEESEVIEEAKKKDYKPNFSKEKEKGLHGWFERNNGKGWVNCRTGGPCGRKSADEGGKYPACRPTKAQCKSAGKGPLRKKKSSKPISWEKKKE